MTNRNLKSEIVQLKDISLEHFGVHKKAVTKKASGLNGGTLELQVSGKTDRRALPLLASLKTTLLREHKVNCSILFENQDDQKELLRSEATLDALANSRKKAYSLAEFGKQSVDFYRELVLLLTFIRMVIYYGVKMIFDWKLFRPKELISQIDQTGYQAISITILINILIGVVITYLMGNQLRYYGANIFAVDGVSITMCRELTPILVAIIVAGRSGSAFAAQLGSMRLNKEVEALQVMGIAPISILVIPRILGLIIVMPLLVVIGDIAGIFGGLVIANIQLDIHPNNFIERLLQVLKVKHIAVGLWKAPLFALFISAIGCHLGLSAEANASSIGKNTTKAVVQGIISVIILNAIIAVILSNLGI